MVIRSVIICFPSEKTRIMADWPHYPFLARSSRLPEGVDQKTPMLCSFPRIIIGMAKIAFQGQGRDIEADAK